MTNRQVIEALYEAFERRDVETILKLSDPAMTLAQTEELPWGGAYEGLAGLQSFLAKLTASVDSRVTVDEYVEAGDAVVAVGWTRGRTRATDTPFDVRVVHVWRVRDGRATRFEPYVDTPAMLAALGGDAR